MYRGYLLKKTVYGLFLRKKPPKSAGRLLGWVEKSGSSEGVRADARRNPNRDREGSIRCDVHTLT